MNVSAGLETIYVKAFLTSTSSEFGGYHLHQAMSYMSFLNLIYACSYVTYMDKLRRTAILKSVNHSEETWKTIQQKKDLEGNYVIYICPHGATCISQ